MLTKEYENRRNMLITRLTVTLQSFIWAGRGAEKKDEVMELSNAMLGNLPGKSPISIGQMLACRETVLISKKTSSGENRTEANINKHRMTTRVADRGGRVTEVEGPQRETFSQQEEMRNMPKWSKRQEPPPGGRGGGRGGGGRGGYGRRGSAGGGGGGYRNKSPSHQSPGRSKSTGNHIFR